MSVLLAVASARYYPGYQGYNTDYNYDYGHGTYNYNPYPYVPYLSNQYQDEFGEASYDYAYPGQASTFGNQIGLFPFTNDEEKKVLVFYVADQNGVRVISSDNIIAPVFTGENPKPDEASQVIIKQLSSIILS